MNEQLKELIKNFKGRNFKNFLEYVYCNFQKSTTTVKEKDKNKYIKMQNNILQYIISNEKVISFEINKKK
jgi:hypothetical protein